MESNAAPQETSMIGSKPNVGEPPPRQSRTALFAALALFVIVGVAATGWLAHDRWHAPKSLDEIRHLIDRRQWSEADVHLRRFLASHPDDVEAMLLHARVLAAKEDFAQCATLLERVPPDYAERARALLRAGQAWHEARRRRDAERVWLACLETTAGDEELPLIQQECRRQLCGMFALERRREDLWKMTDEMTRHALPRERHEPLAMRTRFELVMVEPQVSLSQLEPALENDPQDYVTRMAVGLYYLEAGNSEKARARIYQCVEAHREEPRVWEAWLQLLHKTGDHFGLEQAVRELPPATEQSAGCWKYRLIVAEQKEDLDGAQEAARRALNMRPFDAEIHHRLGQLLLRAGRKEEAQEHLNRNQELQRAQQDLRDAFDIYRKDYARATKDRRTEIAFRIAGAYERLGRPSEAAGWHRVVLSEDPAHPQSIGALERIQNGAGLERDTGAGPN